MFETVYEFYENGDVWKYTEKDGKYYEYDQVGYHNEEIYEHEEKKIRVNGLGQKYIVFADGTQPTIVNE